MKYMGGKNRIAGYLIPIITSNRKKDQYYVEPFVGGCNLIDKVDGNRIGGDNNPYLIDMWKGLQIDTERPTIIERELYSRARTEYNNKTNIEFSNFMIGWIGWMGSYNGRFFDGGYSGHKSGKSERDYISEQMRNTESQIPSIKDVIFLSGSYNKIEIPPKSIIYCDIPYMGTKQYSTSKGFDYDVFWEWCREMSNLGHIVYISEYQAPNDFKCIWEKEVTNSMNTTKTYKPIERLFIYNK